MKKKIIITLSSSIIGSLIILLCIYSIVKTPLYLSNLTYDIVQESYDNYGDYEKSAYQDIVPQNIYECMNYLSNSSYNDRSEFIILQAYHTTPITLRSSSKTAKSIYKGEREYSIKNTKRTIYGEFHTTIYWNLDEDNIWRIVDFDCPP